MNFAMREQLLAQKQNYIKIRTTITFANLWLVPRLDMFKQKYGDVEFQIITSQDKTEATNTSDIDIEICYENMPSFELAKNTSLERLVHDDLFAVCSPDYLETCKAQFTLEDLKYSDLLTVNNYEFEWELWLTKAKLPKHHLKMGTSFDQSIMAIQAAINGKGFFLCRRSLIKSELDNGRLIDPFNIQIPSPGAYYLNVINNHPKSKSVTAFAKWLKSETHTKPPK